MPLEPTHNAEYVAAANLLKTAGYTVIPPEEPDEMAHQEIGVASMLLSKLGPGWRRVADNSLDLAEDTMTTNIVVRCYRRAL